MQNVNKQSLGSATGNQQQQENNYRTVINPVTPTVRAATSWHARPAHLSVASASFEDKDYPTAGRRMSYHPNDQGRPFRSIRDDERDDGIDIPLPPARRQGYIEWNNHPHLARTDSAFTAVSYRGNPQHRLPRHPEQLTWRPVSEHEWRRHVPAGVLRDARSFQREPVHVNMSAAASWPAPHDGPTAVVFRTPSSWSRGSFPSVAEINEHNQQLVRTVSTRGASHEQYIVQREAQANINQTAQREPQAQAQTQAQGRAQSEGSTGTSTKGEDPPAALMSRQDVHPQGDHALELRNARQDLQAHQMYRGIENREGQLHPSHHGARGEVPVHRPIREHQVIQGYRRHGPPQRGLQDHSVRQSIQRDMQAISMSSSTTSSSTSGTCRSPSDSKLGEKRPSDSLAEETSTHSPPSHLEVQYEPTKKRSKSSPAPLTTAHPPQPPPPAAAPAPANFDKLAMLCTATLEMGPLQDNPSGCSCPKSRCIALYCDCFKAGRRCSPGTCTCLNCKNTVDESGPNGARTIAIRTILARNPRAFTTAGMGNPPKELSPGQMACNCIRSRCLKLYCGCFQAGKACDPKVCTCISCLNTEEDVGGQRRAAIQQCLEKRPNAFQVKPKEAGMGCACKNNRCVRKYCECFRLGKRCTSKCVCRECENQAEEEEKETKPKGS